MHTILKRSRILGILTNLFFFIVFQIDFEYTVMSNLQRPLMLPL